MSQFIHAVTGKEQLTECSEDELRQMVRLYPYFGPAQLLLAKKEKEEKQEDAAQYREKASLFVPNRLWFDELMDEREWKEKTPAEGHHTVLETPVTEEEVISQADPKEEEITAVLPETTVLEEPATVEEVIAQPVIGIKTEMEAGDAETVPEGNAQPTEEEQQPVPFVTGKELASVYEEDAEEMDDLSEENDIEDPSAADAEPLRPIPSLRIEPIDPAKMEISFEPYHTVDYFASQGIRFREEDKPKDRLSQQLKSFTEWLKTLKKVPATEVPVVATRQEERKVEQMAEVSVADPEVVTEAMAEVWEKQGNTIKALELYKKLSLQDPAKSAYFAAKIEHLKQL